MLWPWPNDIRAGMQALMLSGWLYGPMGVSLELEPVKTLAAVTGAGGQQLLNIL